MPRISVKLVVTALVAVTGCKSGSSVEEASRTLADHWPVAGPSDPAPVEPAGPVALFIDASRSMMGFAGCGTAPTQFNTTLDHLTADLGITSVIRFGEPARGGSAFEPVPMGRRVHCPEFYDRRQNPDYALFQRAAEDSARPTVLYLTDGVQSDWQGSNPGPSIGLLKDWVERRRALAILMFRSRFSGPAWSEQAHRMLPAVQTENRPFYLFILARNEDAVDHLLRSLSTATTSSARIIRFTPDAVVCKLAPAPKLPKHRFTNAPPWSMVQYRFLDKPIGIVAYDCTVREEYPFDRIRPRVTTVQYRKWGGSAFGGSQAPPPGMSFRTDVATRTTQGSTALLIGAVPEDRTTRFGFVEIRAKSDPGEIRAWIDSTSTDTDATEGEFDRTYRFSWLIEQLGRVHLARQPESPFALTIQYR